MLTRLRCTSTLVIALLASGCSESPTEPNVQYGALITFADHREMTILFESEGVTLVGTLYLPAAGTGFAAVAVNPGSAWSTRTEWAEVADVVQGLNVGVFAYDKRGNAESGGFPVSDEPDVAFDVLADDLVAAARALAGTPLVRTDRIGLFGSSQGGWIVPLAANRDRSTITYAIVTVGGAVSTGQEGLYDELTGYDVCARTATSVSEIVDSLRAVGPSGFDPRASLEELTQPTLWLFGGQDFSHPTLFAIEQLEAVEASRPKPGTVVTLPDANHDLVEGGSICQEAGPRADVLTPFGDWMEEIFAPG